MKRLLPCWAKALLVLLVLIIAVQIARAWAQEPKWFIPLTAEELAKLEEFVPLSCCRSNLCCFGVPSSEIQPQPDDNWRVTATGQVLKRTGWSEIGKNVRCACDSIDNKWVVHRNANTRCVFPVLQSALAR